MQAQDDVPASAHDNLELVLDGIPALVRDDVLDLARDTLVLVRDMA